MSKNTQLFNLYDALKNAGSKGVSKEFASKLLGVKENSIPVYFFSLKKYFNAELETVKNGRKVVAYKLVNADNINVPQYRKNKKGKTVKATVAKINKQETVSEIIGDNEIQEIKEALGLI